MDNKEKKLRPPTEAELKEILQGIIQENRDNMKHPTFPKRPKCNDCQHMIPRTAKCSLLYPKGIPHQIMINKETCKAFKQK